MNKVELNYWWYENKRTLIKELIKKYSKETYNEILDVGCGPGINIKMLEEFGNVLGIDPFQDAINFCEKKDLNVKKIEAEKMSKLNKKFDIIVMGDILEHINEDEKVLDETFKSLKDDGKVIITVPAFRSLFGLDDISLHHKRRYNKKELIQKLNQAGFSVKFINYNHFLLFLPVFLLRKLEKFSKGYSTEKKLKVNINHQKGMSLLINNFLKNYANFETKILRKVKAPFGVSLFCIAEKKNH